METKDLFYKQKNVYSEGFSQKEIMDFSENYKDFLNCSKTERLCAQTAVKMLESAGFSDYEKHSGPLKEGEKLYRIYRNKAFIALIAGESGLDEGVNIIASHTDSPRLDLKPHPLYEEENLAMFKTHYYGGIKKYQWTTVPLALTGVAVLGNGDSVPVSIGEDENDPVFYVSDLLPHLAAKQMTKKMTEGVEGENLNVMAGSIPAEGEEQQPVKAKVLALLYDKYRITEEDLISAELTFVPAYKAKDIGFDRSMVGAYGQDDKVCAYASMKALTDMTEVPEKTCICMWADKEEIGSMGTTGMQSDFFMNFLGMLCEENGSSIFRVVDRSMCLSADVDAALDPTYSGVSDKYNSARLGCGIALAKYTGARGKSGTSDASAEVVGKIRKIFNDNNVIWQIGELGKVDQGGGGTVAQFIANHGIDTIDCGVAVISMHAPYELVSKADVWMAYRGYGAFYRAK